MPDVSGLDKVFDYSVPAALADTALPGCRVSVPLHGRTVKGWIVARGSREEMSRDHAVPGNLADISAVSGAAVVAELVPVTGEVARRWRGPWRAVLASASAPRVRSRPATPRRRPASAGPPSVPSSFARFLDDGGGVVHVPPGASALGLVVEAAARGPVLVVCPTHRMARLGAAWLRRSGLTTAEIPDEWERAEAGVDVVIGARSAVWAPCPDAAAIVVVDEHDDALKEERVPTWDAPSVAVMRAEALGIAWILASPVPSARALALAGDRVHVVAGGWPRIVVEDLNALAAPGSLLGENLLAETRRAGSTVACVLTTTGGARLLVCDACRAVQRCPACAAALALADGGVLHCPRCSATHGTVCTSCGREKLRVLRGGHAHLGREVERSTGRAVTLVSGETEPAGSAGRVLVGTEALLHRVSGVDTVVLADADRDLLAPRVEAPREFLALAARAARAVGADGLLVVQTRVPEHPLLAALAGPDPASGVRAWIKADLETRRRLDLPPFTEVVSVTYGASVPHPDLPRLPAEVWCLRTERGWVLRSGSREAMDVALEGIRAVPGTHPRVVVDPRRY